MTHSDKRLYLLRIHNSSKSDATKNGASKYRGQNAAEPKGEVDKATITFNKFNIPLPVTDQTDRKISKGTEDPTAQ